MSDKTRPIDNRVPKIEYHIAFDTKATPGYLRAVKVTIEVDMLPDDSGVPQNIQAKYNIDLCNHPLYPDLERYVLANRRTK